MSNCKIVIVKTPPIDPALKVVRGNTYDAELLQRKRGQPSVQFVVDGQMVKLFDHEYEEIKDE